MLGCVGSGSQAAATQGTNGDTESCCHGRARRGLPVPVGDGHAKRWSGWRRGRVGGEKPQEEPVGARPGPAPDWLYLGHTPSVS